MKTIITLLMLFVLHFSLSQETSQKADRLFNNMWYKEASTFYEKCARKEKNQSKALLKKLGDSYYFNTDMVNAKNWYEKLVSNYYSEIDADAIFRYAHALQSSGDLLQAERWMKEFYKRKDKEDNRVRGFNQKKIKALLEATPRFTIKNIASNTEYSDFGPMFYNTSLVFSSATSRSTFHKRIYGWNTQPFLNFYIGDLNALASDVSNVTVFSKAINTKYHEATLAFSPDEKKVYFTRNNYKERLGRDQKGTNHLKLYSADLVGDRWVNIKELPFNSDTYSTGHPTVSKNGKKLYFVSDMPGTMGYTDVFVVDILGDDTYSSPRNLGDTVNTSGREMFPYISENTLYFASDGHLGLGGLDVFSSTLKSSSFEAPQNLGVPINSKLDDFGFIIKEDKNTGFVCSNREGGKGDDDIYSFIRLDSITSKYSEITEGCQQNISGYVSNSLTGERIENVRITLFNSAIKKMDEVITNANGAYNFTTSLDCGEDYKLIVNKEGYKKREKVVKTDTASGTLTVPLGIETLDKLIVEENGVLKIKIGVMYFDSNKSDIRYDATIELNKIVFLMTQYPNMVIKIESHTDARQPDDYNLKLSDYRAKSTRDYLIAQGIDATRILSAVGYGETQLVNQCSNGVKCTEKEHQLNRRSEFIIVKM